MLECLLQVVGIILFVVVLGSQMFQEGFCKYKIYFVEVNIFLVFELLDFLVQYIVYGQVVQWGERDNLVDLVEEFWVEIFLYSIKEVVFYIFDRLFLLLINGVELQVVSFYIRCYDDDCVIEVDQLALIIGQLAFRKYL